jgi:hypothetical protein
MTNAQRLFAKVMSETPKEFEGLTTTEGLAIIERVADRWMDGTDVEFMYQQVLDVAANLYVGA